MFRASWPIRPELISGFNEEKKHEVSRNISTPPGSDTSSLQGNHNSNKFTKKSEALEAARPIGVGAYPGFCGMKRLEVFLLPLDGMLVHRRSLPRKLSGFPQQFAGTHLYTWVERGTVRVKCLA